MGEIDLKNIIETMHSKGEDLPEEVIKQLKGLPISKKISVENKMSTREKQRAQRKGEKEKQEAF